MSLTRTLDEQQVQAAQTWIAQMANSVVWSETITAAVLFDKPERITYWTTTHRDDGSLRAVLAAPGLVMGRVDATLEKPDQLTLSVVYTPLGHDGRWSDRPTPDDPLTTLAERLMDAIRCSECMFRPVDCLSRGIVLNKRIKGDINEAVRLACPVAELEWLDQWQFDLVSSECGTNEDHCIFVESWSAPAMHNVLDETTWYTATYDKERHQFFAVLLTGDCLLSHFNVTMERTPRGTVEVIWKHTCYGLEDRGRAMVSDPHLEDRMADAISFIGESFRSYLEEGRVTRLSRRQKLRIARSFMLTHVQRVAAGWSRALSRNG